MFFGLVPVRQILRSDPWQIIRSGSTSVGGSRYFTLRDVLLGLQIAICAVLVTASLVAVRGLARSLQSNYGIQPKNVMLVKTNLKMAGYDADKRVQMHRDSMKQTLSLSSQHHEASHISADLVICGDV